MRTERNEKHSIKGPLFDVAMRVNLNQTCPIEPQTLPEGMILNQLRATSPTFGMAPAKLVCYIGFANGEYTPNICVDVRDAIQQSTFESERKETERERATHAARDRTRLRRNNTERIN